MTALVDLIERSEKLSKLLKKKDPPTIPEKVLENSIKIFDDLIYSLGPYFPPDSAEKKAAMAHPISSQITTFTSAKDRKDFFTEEYFRKKVAALPKDKEIIIASQKDNLKGLLESILIYHFRKGTSDGFKSLRAFRETLEREYYSQPTVKKIGAAEDLLIDLMRMDEVSEIAAILKKTFPKKATLDEFAKQNSLNIPARKKGKQAVKKTAYESLAELIYAAGATARL